MKVALYQNRPVFGKIERNIKNVLIAVESETFDLLVLPELFATGYLFRDRNELSDLSDISGEGYTFTKMKELAGRKDCLVIYGFPEKSDGKLFNSSMAIHPDGKFRVYQKTHLFFGEKEIFDPGESGFFVFKFKQAKIGMMICFDWRYPESARQLALAGAQIICHPSNLVLKTCPEAMVTRALENNLFTITADRIGEESRAGKRLKFIGRSRIVAPDGSVLGELGSDKEGLLIAEINPEDADNKQVTPNNDLFKDRRSDLYRLK